MAQGPRKHIFVSYSHKDTKFLEDLLKFLGECNLSLWADPYIKIGDKWERKIENALKHAGAAILLVSQDFFASPYIKEKELPPLLAAAEKGEITLVCIPISPSTYQVTPLAAYQWVISPDKPLNTFPNSKRLMVWCEIAAKIYKEFSPRFAKPHQSSPPIDIHPPKPSDTNVPLATLTTPIPPQPHSKSPKRLGQIFGLPEIEPHFIPRPQELERIKQAVLSPEGKPVGITGVPLRVGMHGPGGIGKSELAKTLAYDPDIRARFADGIFWISVSQKPQTLKLVAQFLGQAGLDLPADFSLTKAGDLLRTHFAKKACLLILDDVWQAAAVQIFCQIGANSRILLTTRDADVVSTLHAHQEPIEMVDEQTALSILGSWVGAPAETLPPEARTIIHACRSVPLALSLAGGQIRDGWSWTEVSDLWTQGQRDTLDNQTGSIFYGLQASLERLPPSDAQRYLELAVFPEDLPIPISTIGCLWQETAPLSESEAQDLVKTFAQKSLLYFEEAQACVTLHDLQRDYLSLMVEDLPELHRTLIQAHTQRFPSSTQEGRIPWEDLPEDDPYLWDHLVFHLQAANLAEELETLGTNLRYVGKKLWIKGPLAIESDLRQIAQVAPTNHQVARMERIISQAAHLFVQQPHLEGVLTTLLSRMQDEPSLKKEVQRLEDTFTFPYLKAVWSMPDLPDSALVRKWRGHKAQISCCAIDLTNSCAVSGSEDGTIKVWKIHSGELIWTENFYPHKVRCCALVQDKQWVISGTDGKPLHVSHLLSGEVIQKLEGDAYDLTDCAVDPAGRWVAAITKYGILQLWDINTGEKLWGIQAHGFSYECRCVIDATKQWVISEADGVAGGESTKVWNLLTGELVKNPKGYPKGNMDYPHKRSFVFPWVVDSKNRWMVISSFDTFSLWNREKKKWRKIREFRNPSDSFTCCAIDSSGRWMVSGSRNGWISVWDFARPSNPEQSRISQEFYRCVPDKTGRWLVNEGYRSIEVWDVLTGNLDRNFENFSSSIVCMALGQQCGWVMTGTEDGTLCIWDLSNGEVLYSLEKQSIPKFRFPCTMDPHGHWVVFPSLDYGMPCLKLWNIQTGTVTVLPRGKLPGVLQTLIGAFLPSRFGLGEYALGHSREVSCCAIDTTGRWMISGAWDKMVKIWDLEKGQVVHTMTGHKAFVSSCAIDPKGLYAVSGDRDGTFSVWQLKSGKLIRTLEKQGAPANGCTIHSSGQWLATGDEEGWIRIWDLINGNLYTLLRIESKVFDIAWLSNTFRLVVAARGGLYQFELIPKTSKG